MVISSVWFPRCSSSYKKHFCLLSVNHFISSTSRHNSSCPGLGSLKPQREAPGAAWRTEAGSETVDLNLMRTRTLSRTHQTQVDSQYNAKIYNVKKRNNLSKLTLLSVLFPGPGWTANFRDSGGNAASQTPTTWDTSAGGGTDKQETGWANFTEFQPFSG